MMSHENITFNDNGTVTAIPHHPLEWVPELSVGDHETDQLILPHIALLVSVNYIEDFNKKIIQNVNKKSLKMLIKNISRCYPINTQ